MLSAVPGWAFDLGGTEREEIQDVAVDTTGNVYITGLFMGTVDFDHFGSPPGNEDNVLTAEEGDDIFVAAYTPSGEILWAKRFGGAGSDQGDAIKVQGSHVYVTGYDQNPNFDITVDEAFLVKLDAATGIPQPLNWNPQFTEDPDGFRGGAPAVDVAVDRAGGIYLTGDLHSAADFGDGNFIEPTEVLSTGTTVDQYIVKLDANGNLQWATTTGTATCAGLGGFGIDVDDSSSNPDDWRVYVTGSDRYNSGSYGGESLSGQRSVVAQLGASDGIFQWAKSFGNEGTNASGRAVDVTVDGSGNVYVTGHFLQKDGAFSYGEQSNLLTAAGPYEAYVLKVNDSGGLIWAQQLGSNIASYGQEVELSPDGNVVVTGWFQGTATLAPGLTLTSNGSNDTFVATLNPLDGTFLAAESAGSTFTDGAYGIAVDVNGNIYAGGSFGGGTMSFPNGESITSAGGTDGFLWKIGQSAIRITPTSPLVTSEDGGTATFTVVLTEQPTDTVTVELVSLDPSEGTIVGADPVTGKLTLTFTADDYHQAQVVTVAGADDSDPEDDNEPYDGDQGYVIDVLPATSGDLNFDGVDAGTVSLVNLDNDTVSSTFSNNTPVQLKDAKGKSVGVTTSTIDIPAAGAIVDLNVQLDISHTSDEDLSAFLIAPDGTRVELFSGVGGSGDNFSGTVFDDEAGGSINSGSAPFAGIYQPAGLLEAFDSLDPSDPFTENLSGTWTLEIVDSNKFDTGTLNSWSITVLYAPVEVPNSPPTAADDVASTNIETPVIITFEDLLANDTDPDAGDTLSVTSVGSASNGTVIDNENGTVTYTPNAGFVGSDSFTYTIEDSSGEPAQAMVNVTVTDPSAGQTYSSTDTPLNIQDPHRKHGRRATTSVISINSSEAIASLVIDLDINHADEGNLSVTLESSSAGPVDLVYDAVSDTWTLSDPNAFVGTNLGGIWILTVTDTNRDGITGTLNDWSLTATTGVSATAALDEAFAEFAV